MQGLWAQSFHLIFPQHVTRGWVRPEGRVGGEEEEGQENQVEMTPLHAPKYCCCTSYLWKPTARPQPLLFLNDMPRGRKTVKDFFSPLTLSSSQQLACSQTYLSAAGGLAV